MSDYKDISVANSEHEESLELQDDSIVKSDIEKCQSPTPESGVEPCKSKRKNRRGKRRKQKSEKIEKNVQHEAGDSNDWKSDDDIDSQLDDYTDTVMVRPINVPKAPENYNTFIMDEHDECHLYMSFETPNPYKMDPEEIRNENRGIIEPYEDAAYIDIDYEYESPQDFDNIAYYDREFEESYKNNRFDELVRLPRQDLIDGIRGLERRLIDLNEDLVREDPIPVLEKLQAELLELQEKHLELKECNTRLTALVVDSEGGSAPGVSPANSQTLTDGFSPQSDLVSPSHTIESKNELTMSEPSPMKGWSPYSPIYDRRSQGGTSDIFLVSPSHTMESKNEMMLNESSPRKAWSPYSPVYERRSQGETPDIDDDSMSFSKSGYLLKADSPDVNANTEPTASAKSGECCPSQTPDNNLDSLNSSSDGQNVGKESEYGLHQTNLNIHSTPLSSKDVPNTMSSLEESNSVAV